ncbi:hypothetical protein [Georgenia faecalis]|uniref:Uncharacterized protein n=1 Tax=Georgenia faecalis TaxID=2483799 RepID=A0ABV9DA18_9MICO|nr:hypothetical protein [Georgenia faecalis]
MASSSVVTRVLTGIDSPPQRSPVPAELPGVMSLDEVLAVEAETTYATWRSRLFR